MQPRSFFQVGDLDEQGLRFLDGRAGFRCAPASFEHQGDLLPCVADALKLAGACFKLLVAGDFGGLAQKTAKHITEKSAARAAGGVNENKGVKERPAQRFLVHRLRPFEHARGGLADTLDAYISDSILGQ